MNCDKCPHMQKIKAALRPCQACEAGKLHNEVHLSQTDFDRAPRAAAPVQDDGATDLPPDAENRLRIFLASFFQLDPIKYLLARHVANGGGYATFRDDLQYLFDRLSRYRLDPSNAGFRSLVKAWADSILEKIPEFRNVFYATLDANMGRHDRRII